MGSSSGVIYAVIALLWAVVLVPMWLRRHDEVSESRSVDRFQGAMRTLSRREASVDRREVFVPRRPAAVRAHADGEPVVLSPIQQAAARRRLVVLSLSGAVLLALLLGAVGVTPMLLTALPLVLLVAYVLQARSALRREQARALAARRRRAVAARRRRQVAAAQAAADGSGPLRRTARPARPVAAQVAGVAEVPEVAAVAAADVVAADVEPDFYDQIAQRAWDPVPVPVPTYVSAPKAPRSVRVIDLTLPGAWTSGRLDAPGELTAELTAEQEQAAVAIERDPIVTGEVLVERRRAVGD